jgi:hypothetical protein
MAVRALEPIPSRKRSLLCGGHMRANQPASQPSNQAINMLLMRISRRAENSTPDYLTRTFVPVEPVPSLLDTLDNAVLYGRRGTGKTHLLKYMANDKRKNGDVAIYIDLRTVGSPGGIYDDREESVPVRGTTLLIDVVEQLHNDLSELLLYGNLPGVDISRIAPALDAIAEASTEVRVVGPVEAKISSSTEDSAETSSSLTVGASVKPSASAGKGKARRRSRTVSEDTTRTGNEIPAVKFGPLSRALASLTAALGDRRIWIMLDEWSSLPRDLQPILADLLRRSFFPVQGVAVKIGALTRQSLFRVDRETGDYLGLDLGADTSATVDLDDYLVFRDDRSHAESFYAELLYRHAVVLAEDFGKQLTIDGSERFQRTAFSGTAFSTLTKAAEGVPRDALNISGLAASLAASRAITAQNIQLASRDYFLRDKEGKISNEASRLLSDIVQGCFERQTRRLALVRPQQSDNPLIQSLYDNRLLHKVQEGVYLDGDYSQRYDVYLVDFGCLVDVLTHGGGRLVSDGTDTFGLVNKDPQHGGHLVMESKSFVSVNWSASPARVSDTSRSTSGPRR